MDNKINRSYACQNMDVQILEKSSSGGVFFSIAKDMIEKGGVVFGAEFDHNYSVRMTYAETLEQLKPLMTSKYVQSACGTAFHSVKHFLDEGRQVVFFGAPCQIYGLTKYLKRDYDNLITVEFICHGMPQAQIWQKYLLYLKQYGEIETINFRDKTESWNSYSLKVLYKNKKIYRKNLHEDLYLRGFLADLYLMPSCYQCRFKGEQRIADITIGDLWGAEALVDQDFDCRKGISFVWTHTKKGCFALEQIEDELKIREVDTAKALRYNPMLLCSTKKPENSKIFFELLDSGEDFLEVLELCVKASEFRKENPWIKTEGMFSYFQKLKQKECLMTAAEAALYGKHKVAVVGPWSNKNHGGALTYYALYKEIVRQGFFPVMVSQPEDSIDPPDVENSKYIHIPYPDYAIAPSAMSMEELSKLNELYDIFVVGSDQWFNQKLAYGIQEYTNLRWVHATKIKAAYACSFGYDYFTGNEYERAKLSYFLNKFAQVSVREQSGVKLLKEKFNIEATWALDPVFLCDRAEFDELINRGSCEGPSEPYIFSYVLDINGEKSDVLNECGKILNLPVYAIVDSNYTAENHPEEWSIPTVYNASHELWLEYIKKSEYVITDSFHGMCFALIYQKPFIVIQNAKRGNTRFETIVRWLGLEELIVNDVTEIPNVLKAGIIPKYKNINLLLNDKIAECKEMLHEVLILNPKRNAELDSYDILSNGNLQYENLSKQIMEVDKKWFDATRPLFFSEERQNEELTRIDKLYWEQTRELHKQIAVLGEQLQKIDKSYWDITRSLFSSLENQEREFAKLREDYAGQLEKLIEENEKIKDELNGKKNRTNIWKHFLAKFLKK